jgi:hypothetical protein
VVEGGPPRPQVKAGAGRTGTVVTPVPVRMVDGGAVRVQGQQPLPPQLPTLDQFVAIAVPPPAPNAGAGLPAAPGQVEAANSAAREAAVAAQRFVANAATAGVGQPVVVDEANAAAMRRPRRIDNMEIINGINPAIMASTNLIGEAIRVKGTSAAARVSRRLQRRVGPARRRPSMPSLNRFKSNVSLQLRLEIRCRLPTASG